jgi:hypothetical protein
MKRLLISTLVVTASVFGGWFGSHHATADDTTTSTSLASALPTTFTGMQGISSMALPSFQSCAANTMGNGLQDAGSTFTMPGATSTSANGLTVNGGTAVCGSDQLSGTEPSCPANGKFDSTVWDRRESQIKLVEAAISCKQNNISKIQSELSCFNNQASLLDTQINSLKGIYQQNIQRFNTDVGTYQNLISDRKNQESEVAQKLGLNADGSSSGSAGGLLGIQSTLTDAVNNGVPNEVASVNAQQTKIQQDTASYYQAIKNEEIQDSQQCFTGTDNFQCKSSNGAVTPCSAQQFLIERFSENLGINAGGQVNTNNAFLTSQQQSESSALQSVLTGIFGSFASNPQATTDSNQQAQNATSALNSSSTIFTPQQILSSPYWSELQQFDTMCNTASACLPVSTFFYNTMVNCYNQSINTVNTDIQTPGRALYTSWNAINQETTNMKTQVTNDLQKYSQIYTAAMAALTGNHYPLDLTNCNAASASNQTQCLTDLQTNLNGLLNGSTAASQINMTIAARNSANTITLSCYGVNGCVTSLKTLGTNLQTEVTNQTANMNDYINQANNAIQSATTTFQSEANAMLANMKKELQQANATLSQNGMSPIRLPDVQTQPLTKSCQQSSDSSSSGAANCIYDMPQNMFALFGIPDVSGNSFSDGSQEVGQLASKEATALSTAQQAETELQSDEAKCKTQLAQSADKGFTDLLSSFNLTNCPSLNWCAGDTAVNVDSLQDLVNNVQAAGLTGSSDSSDSVDTALQGGVSCTPGTSLSQWQTQLAQAGQPTPGASPGTTTVASNSNEISNNMAILRKCQQIAQQLKSSGSIAQGFANSDGTPGSGSTGD